LCDISGIEDMSSHIWICPAISPDELEEKPTSNFDIQLPEHLQKMVRQFTTKDGNYVLLCGFYETAEDAKLASTLLKELYFPEVVPVYVNPKQLTCSPIELKN
jgi:hypothetical protein